MYTTSGVSILPSAASISAWHSYNGDEARSSTVGTKRLNGGAKLRSLISAVRPGGMILPQFCNLRHDSERNDLASVL